MPFFYKNKNQTETQKILDKHKTGEINVYTFIFLRKNIRINIYPLSEKALGAFPFSLFRTNHVRTSATSLLQT